MIVTLCDSPISWGLSLIRNVRFRWLSVSIFLTSSMIYDSSTEKFKMMIGESGRSLEGYFWTTIGSAQVGDWNKYNRNLWKFRFISINTLNYPWTTSILDGWSHFTLILKALYLTIRNKIFEWPWTFISLDSTPYQIIYGTWTKPRFEIRTNRQTVLHAAWWTSMSMPSHEHKHEKHDS